MTTEEKQPIATDPMSQNLLTHLLNKLQEKGVLSQGEVDDLLTRAEKDTQRDEKAERFVEAATN